MPFVLGGILEEPGFDEKGLIPQAALPLSSFRFTVTSPICISWKSFKREGPVKVFFQEEQVNQRMEVEKRDKKSVPRNGVGCGNPNKGKKVNCMSLSCYKETP